MVQTKITLTLDPHDLKIIHEALVLLVVRMEDAMEHPENYVPQQEQGQLDMFANDAKVPLLTGIPSGPSRSSEPGWSVSM